MKELILCIAAGYIFYLIFEKINLDSKRKKIKCVIHVNGIRGKSTVCRLLDAGIRAGGYSVFTKVTGTSPRYISTDGNEYEIKRKAKPNIKEQIKIFNKAVKAEAEILILECMAVKPEYQKICEENIVQADINIITNVREDHLDEMGDTLDKIAASLSNTIPTNGFFFTSDKKYFDFFKKVSEQKNTKAIEILESKNDYERIDFKENVALALNVCKFLNIDEEIALEGIKNYKKDPGVLKTIKYETSFEKKVYFINALAANDPDSSELILEKLTKKNYWNINRFLMINNRFDRISRWEQYIEFVKKVENNFEKILISGDNQELFKEKIMKKGIKENRIIQIQDIDFFKKIEKDSLIFAVGNICGKGKKIVEHLESIGEIHE